MIAALYVRKNSIYKSIPDVDCFDLARDALNFDFSCSVIAHPPCRGWGRLRHFARPAPGELALGLHAVEAVRRCGGVLEHPSCSSLFDFAGLPLPGQHDDFGFTYSLDQSWFGHRAPKLTWLYIVGVLPDDIPLVPFHLGVAPGRIENMGCAERERTPPELAHFLVDLVNRIK